MPVRHGQTPARRLHLPESECSGVPDAASSSATGRPKRDNPTIARHFNAGVQAHGHKSHRDGWTRSSLRDLQSFHDQPGVKTPGYCHPSLRDIPHGAGESSVNHRFTLTALAEPCPVAVIASICWKRRRQRPPIRRGKTRFNAKPQ